MVHRRALIIAPIYDGSWLPFLSGKKTLVPRLTKCLEENGKYEVKALDGIVEPPDFIQALSDFFDSDGELLFYFYGHGCISPSDSGIFATSSAQRHNEGVMMSEVTKLAMNKPAREVVLIFDCCHAGAALPVTEGAVTNLADQVINTTGRVILAGCASHQSGWEVQDNEDKKMIGAFSHYILKGLEGEAASFKGKVRGSSLGTYVTEIFSSWNQNPIARSTEGGDRQCIITSGFREEIKVNSVQASKTHETKIIGAPFKPSQLFVGRSAEIDELQNLLLLGDKQVALSATVEGLGGIGKTELVLQLIYQPEVQATYNTIIWIDGAGPLPPQWEKIAAELNIPNPGEDAESLISVINHELREQGNPLIILDNASEWGPVAKLIPKDIALLVTTRAQGFGGNSFHHMQLQVLSDESARSFLLQMVPRLEQDHSLPLLIEALEGHALALELAGWNINYMDLSVRDYIRRLNNHKVDLSRAISATKYGKAVDACLALTWADLKNEAARTLWRRASLFAPTSAHRNLLKVSFGGDRTTRDYAERIIYEINDDTFGSLLCGMDEFDEAYAELREFHVIARVEGSNGERWAMHRLVRDFGRARLKSGEVTLHAVLMAEWLKSPTFSIEPEVPHFVSTIIDSARYVSEFSILRERFGYEGAQIATRAFSVPNYGERVFNASEFIFYIRDQLKDPKALTIILQGLTDVNDDVRLRSLELLESVGPIPEVLDGLAASLNDPNASIRNLAASTLAEHGGEKTISILNLAVKHCKKSTSFTAVKALGLMGHRAQNALINALECMHRESSIEAALLLSEQGCQEGTKLLIEEIQSIPSKNQGRFIDALGKAKDLKAIPTIIKFLSNLKHQTNAIFALGEIGDVSVYPQLIPFLKNNISYGSGKAAMEVLLKEPEYKTLKTALYNDDLAIQIIATCLLYQQGNQEVSTTLIDNIESVDWKYIIESVDWKLRRDYIAALGQTKSSDNIPILIKSLKEDNNSTVRIYAIRALGAIGVPKLKSHLVEIINSDPNTRVKEVAQEILNQIDNK